MEHPGEGPHVARTPFSLSGPHGWCWREDPLHLPRPPKFQGPRTHHPQVVPRAAGEVASDLNLPGLEHRGDEQSLPPQELAVHCPGAGILGEPSNRRDGQGGLVTSEVSGLKGPMGRHGQEPEDLGYMWQGRFWPA